MLTRVAYSHQPPRERHRVPDAPIYYTCLKETQRIPDISDPTGSKMAVMPAIVRIHAVHVADDAVACSYTRRDGDVPDLDRDWFTIGPGEVPCEDCRKATQGNQ
jgi:hypothetical protein